MYKRDFERFYMAQVDKVYRFVFFRSGLNKELAEDLVSEIFIKALKHFGEYDQEISKSAWLMTIAKNHLANYWRDNKSVQPLPDDSEDGEVSSDAVWLKGALIKQQQAGARIEIVSLLEKLEQNEREIVTFHYLLGYSYMEIGKLKKMSTGAAKVAAHRAMKKLKEIGNEIKK